VEGRCGTGKRPSRSRCASVEHGACPNYERRGLTRLSPTATDSRWKGTNLPYLLLKSAYPQFPQANEVSGYVVESAPATYVFGSD